MDAPRWVGPTPSSWRRWRRRGLLLASVLLVVGCESAPPAAEPLAAQAGIDAPTFAALVERVSEPGGYFDTDNLISNESGYLNVMDALSRRGLEGGAYIGVGPDQNFSYIAELRPSVAFIVDVRRDNMLHHLLLKALVEMSPTRVEFLSHLHGIAPPPDPQRWVDVSVEDVVAYVDGAAPSDEADRSTLHARVRRSVADYGVPLSEEDLDTVDRFHRTFMDAGPSLRFTSFGRAPRPYYPTYRQLVLETDADGDRASYLASADRYGVVRQLHLANRIMPVVGDLAGAHAVREMGAVVAEMDLEVDAFYVSNVEYYLWQDGTFGAWVQNVRELPLSPGAVVIRSYFPNFGRGHPSAIRGYYASQSLQPLATLAAGGFDSYWSVVTRDVVPLR